MKYIVIEIQTSADGTVGNIVTAHDTRNEAESKYHATLATAATSGRPCHAALLVESDGTLLDTYCYKKEAE